MNQARAKPTRSVPLRSRLLTIALAGILPLALVAGLGLVSIVNDQKLLAKQRSLEATRLAATAVEVELRRSLDVLQALSQSTLLDEDDIDSFAGMVHRVLPSVPSWYALLVITPEGQVIRRISRHDSPASEAIAEPRSFAELMRTGEPQVGNMGLGPGGLWGIPIRVPVDIEGNIRYVLTAVLKPESIVEVISDRRLPQGWITTVLDARGMRIARSQRHQETVGQPASPTLQSMLVDNPADEGVGMAMTVEGASAYTAFVRLRPSRWVVATGAPTETVEAGAARAFTLYGGGLLLSLMFAVAAALFATRRINVPMRQLRRAAQAIGQGQSLQQVPDSEIEEVREVGQALAAAAQARRASEAERDSMLSQLELAQQDLTEQISDLNSLHTLGNRLQQLPTLDAQLQAIIDVLCELHGATHGLLALSDGQSPLRIHASKGFSPASLELMDNVAPGLGVCGAAVQEGCRVVVTDTETDPRFTEFRAVSRIEGFRSAHSTPILHSDGSVLGTLTVQLKETRPPTEREIRLADLAAGLAAVFIDRARAQSKAGMLERRLQVALDSSTVPFAILSPQLNAAGELHDFRLDFINPTGAESLQGTVVELTGRRINEVLGPNANPQAIDTLVAAATQQQPRDVEMRSTAFASERWVRLIATPFEHRLAVWFADVTKSKRQEQAILEADRRKDEFLATLAHELRNPLAPIRLAAGLFGSPSASEAQKLRSQQIIERQVRHMALLLDDLFDISRITLGKLVLRKESLDLRAVVEAAVETARAKIESKRHELIVEQPTEPILLDADPLRLEQILVNLLNNAAKFTAQGGQIRVRAALKEGMATVSVADNGLGIAREHLQLIFERFAQVPTTQTQVNAGLGIGLALAKGLANLHGGDIRVSSEGVGLGAEFELNLPALAPPQRDAQPVKAGESAAHTRRVLVADDNRDIAETMAEVLRLEGHEVHLAFDGVEAFERYRQLEPEVVLLDIGMPGLRGDEVARMIRSSDSRVRLVAITGWGQPSDKENALAAGFDVHLTKPVDIAQLIALVGS
ncbi:MULTISPECIES: ATP-binding protein [Pseudomonadaceae]|uniref:ATP-binding protein n=1 Tax=Pseudomonadaceae TaxID=135621 RepID=UPI0015E29B52|nr:MULTISPECIES: ATP-binding protein [Pseudomonadaceae]MBA1279636.1 response regulator [Stutzerimonas stutzeri]MBC8649613.1 response regulator [Pseudomonas sp. MT4]QXY90938.1 response regulator [Pseudomonas sp. MTM4]